MKFYREKTGIGLAEAKAVIDELLIKKIYIIKKTVKLSLSFPMKKYYFAKNN